MKKIVITFLYVLSHIIIAQNFDKPFRFPFQDINEDYGGRWQLVAKNNILFAFYTSDAVLYDPVIYYRTSLDGGNSWSNENLIIDPTNFGSVKISACVTNTGRIILIYSVTPSQPSKVIYSDNNGTSWSSPVNIIGSLYIENPHLSTTPDNKILLAGSPTNHFFISTDNGVSWTAKSLGFRLHALTPVDQNAYLGYYLQNDDLYMRKSSDGGTTWSSGILLKNENFNINYITAIRNQEGLLVLLYSVIKETPFPGIFQTDLNIITSSDSGEVWTSPLEVTLYKGYDGLSNLYTYNDEFYVNFLSDRWFGTNQEWSFKIGVTQDTNTPPVILSSLNEVRFPELFIMVYADGENEVEGIKVHYTEDNILFDSTQMFDDGMHEDFAAGDNIWAVQLGPFDPGDNVWWSFSGNDALGNYFIGKGFSAYILMPEKISSISSGSLSNWYSSLGSEREEGFIPRQQYGLRYPSEYPYQDIQASKGFWMGVRNFTNEAGTFLPYAVVHSGPRITGEFEFFPMSFVTKVRFEQPQVIVNGNTSMANPYFDVIDPGMNADIEIINELNTRLGITVTRRIFQFSHPEHDNYIVNEYTFKNTGNTDSDPVIELPGNSITGLQLFYLYRWAVCAQTRYVIGNGSGWGINTMLDARGDGVIPNPAGENFRTIFGWHGYWPSKSVPYDNIGGPIWQKDLLGFVTPDDTIGRLGAVQFPGVLTLHADVSALNHSDNPQQPSSTIFIDSDNLLLILNSITDTAKMRMEYELMTRGHDNPRHAWAVEPSGNFAVQTNSPEMGTPGGFSAANGYGPYDLSFGDSIKIIWVEGVAGISREKAVYTGKLFKQGLISALEKNIIVLTGKDSLMKTWQNASANYNSGFNLPTLPLPPKKFKIDSKSDRIDLSWEAFNNSGAVKYRIYRSMDIADSLFRLLYECPSDTFSYSDTDVTGDKNYRYYIASVNNAGYESNKIYTIAPAGVKILTGIRGDDKIPGEYSLMQNYPNPFNPLTKINFSISDLSFTSLKIYDILGNEVAVLISTELEPGEYTVSFDGKNLSSGVYIYKLQSGTFSAAKKMILMR